MSARWPYSSIPELIDALTDALATGERQPALATVEALKLGMYGERYDGTHSGWTLEPTVGEWPELAGLLRRWARRWAKAHPLPHLLDLREWRLACLRGQVAEGESYPIGPADAELNDLKDDPDIPDGPHQPEPELPPVDYEDEVILRTLAKRAPQLLTQNEIWSWSEHRVSRKTIGQRMPRLVEGSLVKRKGAKGGATIGRVGRDVLDRLDRLDPPDNPAR